MKTINLHKIALGILTVFPLLFTGVPTASASDAYPFDPFPRYRARSSIPRPYISGAAFTDRFDVCASSSNGLEFANDTAQGHWYKVTAKGEWRPSYDSPWYGPNGRSRPNSGVRAPDLTVASLIVQRSNLRDYGPVGTSERIYIASGDHVRFVFNDLWGSYGDNDGCVEVTIWR